MPEITITPTVAAAELARRATNKTLAVKVPAKPGDAQQAAMRLGGAELKLLASKPKASAKAKATKVAKAKAEPKAPKAKPSKACPVKTACAAHATGKNPAKGSADWWASYREATETMRWFRDLAAA